MITGADGEVQEITPEFLEDFMEDGAVLGRMVQEADGDDGFGTAYNCFESGTTKAWQELEDRPVKKSAALRPLGGRPALRPKPRQLPLDGGVDSAADEDAVDVPGSGLAELMGAVGKLRDEVRRKSSSGGEEKSSKKR